MQIIYLKTVLQGMEQIPRDIEESPSLESPGTALKQEVELDDLQMSFLT